MTTNATTTTALSKIRCITFDLDDTLWPVLPVIQNAELAMYEWLVANYPRIGDNFESVTALNGLKQQTFLDNPSLRHDLTALRKKLLSNAAFQSGYGDRLIEPAFRVFWEARQQVEFFPTAMPLLDTLKPHYQMGSITNGNADLEQVGLAEHMSFHVSAETAGFAKPDAAIFLTAAEAAGVKPKEILHIGDDLEADVMGALDVKMSALWFNPEGKPVPDDVAENYPELTQISCLSVIPALLGMKD